MLHERVFHDLNNVTGRFGVYTQENKDHIPESGGCYAWFLPLWTHGKRLLSDLIQLIDEVINYDQQPERDLEARFTWESVMLRLWRTTRTRDLQQIDAVWFQIMEDKTASDLLQQTLLEASLFMPPLYVGKAANLRRRYAQHTEGRGKGNVFHSRFTACAADVGLPLSVNDLLFVCVKTPEGLEGALENIGAENPERLVEKILMGFCRPPFSLR